MKHNELKQLKRKHLWPSLLLFLFYLGILRVLLLIAVSIFNQQVVQAKFLQGDNAAETLVNDLDELLHTKDEAFAMTYLHKHNIEAYALLGENHSIIDKYGDITVDFQNKKELPALV